MAKHAPRDPRRRSDLETNVAPDALPEDPRRPDPASAPPVHDGTGVEPARNGDDRLIDRSDTTARDAV